MLGLFNDPFFGFGAPVFRRSFNPDIFSGISMVDRYLNAMDEAFNSILRQQKDEEKDGDDKPKADYASQRSTFSRHSLGGIEECREVVTDDKTGEVNESITRRIGDRWYRVDTKTDKDGHKVSKETWHNVSEHQVDDFVKDWDERSKALGLTSEREEKKSIQHDKKENK